MTKIHSNSSTINHPCTLTDGIFFALFRLLLLLIFLFSLPMAAAQQVSSDGDTVNTSTVSPSMSVIVIVLVLVFIVTGTLSIYVHQCGENSPPSAAPIVISGAVRSSDHVLRKSVIDTFPTFLYSAVKELKVGKGSLECAVCLNEFEDDETLRLLPICDHVFHRDCIDAWLAGHTTCPVCRANLIPVTPRSENAADSAHGIDLDTQMEVSSSVEENNQRYEVQITIKDEGTASEEHDPKRNSNGKFPRSHSTGHSMSPPGEDLERYTLRLPAEVRRQLVARTRLKRATSLVVLPRESSSRQGYRAGDGEGSGSSRYGRLFGRFLLPRMGSFRSTTKIVGDGDVTAGSVSSKRLVRTAVTPLESLPPLPV